MAAALEPVLNEIAGLPGAPARISQAAATYQQGTGNTVSISLDGPAISGRPPVYHLLLPDQLPGPTVTTSQLASEVRWSAGPSIVASVIGDGPGASQAQHAVAAALMRAPGLPGQGPPPVPGRPAAGGGTRLTGLRRGPAVRRAAGLGPARLALQHLTALRAGLITLAQLP